MTKILGLDASTSCIGWVLLTDSGKYIDCAYLDLHKEKNIYKKLDIFVKFIDEELIGLKDLKIYMESALLMFKTRSSMASVIAKLQEVNGMYRALLYQKLGVETELINPMSARRLAGLTIPRKTDTKEFILSYVKSLNLIPVTKWEVTRKGKNKKTNYDMADATIICLAAMKNKGVTV